MATIKKGQKIHIVTSWPGKLISAHTNWREAYKEVKRLNKIYNKKFTSALPCSYYGRVTVTFKGEQ